MLSPILAYTFASFALAHLFARATEALALKLHVVDAPDSARKLHRAPKPLLGGFAIYASFFIVCVAAWYRMPGAFAHLAASQLIALFAGSTLLMIGGYLDDRYSLPPYLQIIFPLCAAFAIIVGGVGLAQITNPFGAPFRIARLTVGGIKIAVDALVFVLLMAMMYTTKILDGIDGLVSGLTAIGALIIFFLTMSARFFQPDIGLISIIFAGACLGFLTRNFYPARIFLGEGGSLFTGFILGNLAVISGGKIATALLVMGLPMIDFAYTLYRRKISGAPLMKGDRNHLHFQMLKKGLSVRRLVALMYCVAALFGILTLFLQSNQKLIALLALVTVSIIVIQFAYRAHPHS